MQFTNFNTPSHSPTNCHLSVSLPPEAVLALPLGVDFPDSGENVREADKRGASPAGLAKISDF